MKSVKTIIFDLYGTLLQHSHRALLRDLLKNVGGDITRARKGMDRLLLTSFDSEHERLAAWCEAIGIENPSPADRESCRAVLQRHLAAVAPFEGVRPLLAFLKRRGFKLGLISNSADAFKAPLEDLGLVEYFDETIFSCDFGTTKPDREIYLELCARLKTAPMECLFVGDSRANDYLTPRSLGMRAVSLRDSTAQSDTPITMRQLAWTDFSSVGEDVKQLIHSGKRIEAFGKKMTILDVEFLADAEQGRYNTVAKVLATNGRGGTEEFYCKRYLLPESAHVEETAYRAMEVLGLTGCRAAVLDGPEPLLLMTPAAGEHWGEMETDEAMVEQIGGHCAAAYLIGNADLRPRNTLVEKSGSVPRLNVIDLEHCFFDRALDLTHLENPYRPGSIDRLNGDVGKFTKRRALSFAATRRCRRSFVPVNDINSPQAQRFRAGWRSVFERAKKSADELSKMLLDRIYDGTPLIVGTQAYRRSLARVDVADMMERIGADPDEALDKAY